MSTNIITELSVTLGRPVHKVNLRDPNVFQREQCGIKEISERLAFTEAIRFDCQSLRAEIRSNGSYLALEVKADVDAGAWSVNKPDQITLTQKVQSTSIGYPLFATGATMAPRANEIIHGDSFSSLLNELELGQCDSLHFYKNAVVYYARAADGQKFLKLTKSICWFVSEITQPKTEGMYMKDLPGPFSDLNEYAQRWAISDDDERLEAVENASTEVLKDLVGRISSRLPGINAYLHTHFGEKEAVLESLAQAVAEAQIALRRLS